jgi:RNA-directed DNA polymerase
VAPKSIDLKISEKDMRAAFGALSSPRAIADLLEVEYKTLCFYLYKKQNYEEFELKRASGKPRIISAPTTPLKIIQRKLAQVLYAAYGSRSVVHGFTKGRSIRTNAKRHLGAEWILNFDLQDFFPTIHFGRVSGLFAGKPYKLPKDVSETLARICCHKGALPIGAPTSPVVANMICGKMDAELKALAWSTGCTYTRYADDVSISTKALVLDKRIAERNASTRQWEISKEIEEIVARNSFQVNPDKTRIRGRRSSMEVTGVRVNSGLNVSMQHHRQVRAMLHAWEKFGEGEAQTEHRAKYQTKQYKGDSPPFRDILRGKIEFIGFIRGRDDRIYLKLLQRIQKLGGLKAKPIIIGQSTHESVIRQGIWLLFDNIDGHQGTAFAAQGGRLLTAAHNVDHQLVASRPSFDKAEYPVTVVRRDDSLDIAEISIQTPLPVQFPLATDPQFNLQTPVCVLGFPDYHLDDSVAFRYGKIVQERWYRFGTTKPPIRVKHFIVDADIVKGNSGGPILDQNNQVIGIAVKGVNVPSLLSKDDQLSSFVPLNSDFLSTLPNKTT